MQNELTDKLQEISMKEQELEATIKEKQEDAYRALADLHASIEELYILKKGEKAILLGSKEFIETVMDKVFKIDVEGIGQKQNECTSALETATWGINKALDIISDIEYNVKRGNIE